MPHRHIRKEPLDPRTLIILLIAASVIAFVPKTITVEVVLVLALTLLQVFCGYPKMALMWLFGFGVLMVFLNYVFPSASESFLTIFTIGFTYARKIYPCLMIGAIMVKGVSIHKLTSALQSWHVPQTLLIPLSVTIRYFPTLKDEAGHIRDAMKLKTISPMERLECFVVPLIMSATNTADELSAAAVTRGIENPAPNTTTEPLKMASKDYACLICALILCIGIIFAATL